MSETGDEKPSMPKNSEGTSPALGDAADPGIQPAAAEQNHSAENQGTKEQGGESACADAAAPSKDKDKDVPSKKKSSEAAAAAASLLLLLTASAASAVSSEAIQLFLRGGASAAAAGVQKIGFEAWSFSTIAILMAALFFWALTNRISAGCLLAGLASWFFAFAHALKYQAVGKPLAMSDFALIGDVGGVLGGVVSANKGTFAAMAALLTLAVFALVFIFRHRPLLPLRPVGRCVLALALGFQLAFGMEVSGLTETTGLFFRDESVNGFLMNFLRSSHHAFMPPEDYGKEAVFRILSDGGQPSGEETENLSAEKTANSPALPDVWIYVGESFFDTNRLKNVTFDRDPTPVFHRLISSENVISGRLTSPERGGTTANVEFELMTGLPMAVFPESNVPYHSEIFRPLEAMPRVFQRAGARFPLAVHNSYKEMFSYGTVYPQLGFRDFIDLSRLSTESFSGSGTIRYDRLAGKNVLFEGLHPSDEPLAIALVRAMDELQPPLFMFGLSVVSHGGFSVWPESEKTVRIASGNIPSKSKEGLEHMANVLERADRALGYVVDAVMKQKRPALMFFMGDHLPYIDETFLIDGGVDFGPDQRRRFDVPFFILANFPLPEIEIPDGTSAFMMPAHIMKLAGVDGGPYFRFLERKSREITALSRHVVIFPDGREYSGPDDPAMSAGDAARVREYLREFSMFAWDRIHGGEFSTFRDGALAPSPMPALGGEMDQRKREEENVAPVQPSQKIQPSQEPSAGEEAALPPKAL